MKRTLIAENNGFLMCPLKKEKEDEKIRE